MTVEQFKKALHEEPFQPFVIRMADGRAFEVPDSGFVAQSPSGRTVAVFPTDEDCCSILDLLLMSELEVKNSGYGARTQGNGA